MRQGDKNGRTMGKDVVGRRHKASELCKISVGRHFDYCNMHSTVRAGYAGRFGHIRKE